MAERYRGSVSDFKFQISDFKFEIANRKSQIANPQIGWPPLRTPRQHRLHRDWRKCQYIAEVSKTPSHAHDLAPANCATLSTKHSPLTPPPRPHHRPHPHRPPPPHNPHPKTQTPLPHASS